MPAERVFVVIAPALLLAACNREKSFDERYASARQAIGASAAAIDAEIASRESEAAAVDAVVGAGGTGGARTDRGGSRQSGF